MPHNQNIKDQLVRLFSSLRLAVVLLIILAVFSVAGTFVPQDQETVLYLERYGEKTYRYLKLFGLIDLYHSWGFRLLMSLLTANLVVCTSRRLKGVYRRTLAPEVERDAAGILKLRVSNELPSPGNVHVIERVLSEKRYRVIRRGGSIYASKGRIGPWGDMITHLSIMIILLGALVGSLGFVGTVNVYEGDWTDRHYNWNVQREVPLGFRLFVDDLSLKYYPVEMRIGVRNAAAGTPGVVFETREGGSFVIPETGLTVTAKRISQADWEAELEVSEDGRLLGVYNTGKPRGGPLAPPAFSYEMAVTAYKDPVLKGVASSVRLVREGRTVKRGIIEVNSPLSFEGLSIYQSAFERDENGRYFCGFQIVKDPGVPLVWAGFALLLAGLVLSFFFYHRQVWAHVGGDKIAIGGSTSKDWPGFMREYGGLIKSFMQEVEP